jgi:GAF domain
MTLSKKSEEVRGLFRDLAERSRTLSEDLKRENERVHARIVELQADLVAAEKFLATEFEGTTNEREKLREETRALLEENRDFARRYVELEEHAANLANLYAATFQLHATLDPGQVVKTISEIAINLIGASEFILYLADEAKGDFFVAVREGERPPDVARIRAPEQPIEHEAIAKQRTVFLDTAPGEVKEGLPICCTPLVFRNRLVGVLTVYALLSHKKAFSELDSQLFDLLGDQAALAIVSSQAYVAVDRKLKTVQQFMSLLKS